MVAGLLEEFRKCIGGIACSLTVTRLDGCIDVEDTAPSGDASRFRELTDSQANIILTILQTVLVAGEYASYTRVCFALSAAEWTETRAEPLKRSSSRLFTAHPLHFPMVASRITVASIPTATWQNQVRSDGRSMEGSIRVQLDAVWRQVKHNADHDWAGATEHQRLLFALVHNFSAISAEFRGDADRRSEDQLAREVLSMPAGAPTWVNMEALHKLVHLLSIRIYNGTSAYLVPTTEKQTVDTKAARVYAALLGALGRVDSAPIAQRPV